MKFPTVLASLLLASVVVAHNVTIVDADQGLSIEEYDDESSYNFPLPLPPLPLLSAGEERSLSRKAHHHQLAARQQETQEQTHSLEKRYKIFSGGQGTFYYGSQLNNPYCGGKWPNDNSMIVAVPAGSPAKCGDEVHLHYKNKVVAAHVVDRCGGCANSYSVDMTKKVFQQLANLDEGRLFGLRMRVIPKN